MRLKRIAASLLRNLKNIPGWTTHRKLLVIESDDWGSIRLPSREAYHRFDDFGLEVRNSQYNRFDALESNEDLECLFEVLHAVKDGEGKPGRLTANTIVSNPDFEKIRRSGFSKYYYEHFTETLRRYPNHDRVFQLYQDGMNAGLFKPQFHGREHLNINRWMDALQGGRKEIRFSFDQGSTYSGKDDYSFMEALDMDSPLQLKQMEEIVSDGLRIFKETFGYLSKSFIAPCYTWDSRIESTLANNGVKYLQGGTFQFIPKGGFGNYKKAYHILGKQNNHKLVYLTRNCAFEPTLVKKNNWVDYTLSNIQDAFRWKKPAIITAHRINFVGFADETNRDQNLKLFKSLLSTIVKKWPDIEFVSSDELGDIIVNDKNEG